MSFYIQTVGSAEAVKALANGAEYIPQQLKDAIGVFADAIGTTPLAGPANKVMLTANGHYGPNDSWSSVILDMKAITCAPEPTAATVEPQKEQPAPEIPGTGGPA